MISIVIPAYDRADLLDITLNSVTKQTGIKYEIIVVDDNSSFNDIYDVCKKYNVIYYKNTHNSGAQISRNKGVELASFEYIAFIDSDDLWETKDKLLNQYKVLKNNSNISIVFTALKYIDIKGKVFNISNLKFFNSELHNDFDKIILNKDIIGTYSSVMIRKKDFIECGKCNISLPARQDWDLWIRLSKLGNAHCLMNDYTLYRIHDNQISSGAKRKLDGFSFLLLDHQDYFYKKDKKGIFYVHIFKVILLKIFSKENSIYYDQLKVNNLSVFKKLEFIINLINKVPFFRNILIKKIKKNYLFKGLFNNKE